MSKSVLIFSLLLISFFNHSQEVDIDFSKIETIDANVKLIGAGESTHGTSEFSTVRLELFKFLVENHDFNTFFLEADYSACQRVNRYIHGELDTVYSALEEVILWPWLTEEMIDIILWCRKYNSLNNNAICFVGSDMQLIRDDYKALNRLFKENKLLHKLDSVFFNLEYTSNDSVLLNRKSKWTRFKDLLSHSDLSKNQLKQFENILPTVDQWFAYKTEPGIKYNFRDSCMASNMMRYLNQYPGSKGFYFAHNTHVSNTVYSLKGRLTKKSAGAYLKEGYGESYIPLALLSSHLRFNALTCIDGVGKMKQFQLIPKKRRDLERWLANYDSGSFYISAKNINKINKFNITSIGAGYDTDCNGAKIIPIVRLKEGMYDGFIFLGPTKPTQFIDKIKSTYFDQELK